MKLHGALRLSRGKANSTSLERQREMLEMWAGRNGHEIASWSEDEDVSALPVTWNAPTWPGICHCQRARTVLRASGLRG